MLRVARVIQGEERKLDARRARIETDDRLHAEACGSPGAAFGAARASSAAIAQDARRVRSLSARLVRMMGTRAPRATPAASAPPRKVSCLASILPASRLGTTRTSAFPATGETIPFSRAAASLRSEEHTSELPSLMRNS